MSDRMPTPGISQAARIGEMTTASARHHRLKGRCPDGAACTLPVHCSQLCSRLESTEITAEMQANVRAQRTNGTKKPASDDRPKEAAMDEPNHELGEDTVPPPVPVTDYPCKVDGCTNRTTARMGRYAYLCADHRGTVANKAATPKKRTATAQRERGGAANGKVNGRGRVELLGLLVAKQNEIDAASKRVFALEQEFASLADELGNAGT